ncbi:unnamed protein product [Prorocentrum cordatum]|uniref:Uncharacterized protein n=1 Tax=Prorocentrum cordatum TaxID=2364126 RepID=A0ABN9XG83_9DINO|nr:unnamed protein product [Polarella glacialis]
MGAPRLSMRANCRKIRWPPVSAARREPSEDTARRAGGGARRSRGPEGEEGQDDPARPQGVLRPLEELPGGSPTRARLRPWVQQADHGARRTSWKVDCTSSVLLAGLPQPPHARTYVQPRRPPP